MAEELLNFDSKPMAKILIAGWRRQWSDGGEISGGLPRYLISKLGAKKSAKWARGIQAMLPFPSTGTHDTYRPGSLTTKVSPSNP
ncbi:MAG: hypothetical protein CM1200mP22_04850 [Dehalococcoidia bacterium]|nr:MAG: hypothetical protein CM1200mP22_04850 [Dehalococcoidia bacterium]